LKESILREWEAISLEQSAVHVLLNLDTQQYVLSRDELQGKVLGMESSMTVPSLGDAAMCCICWSQDPCTSMKANLVDTRGEWAANRFAIISLSVFDEISEGREGWTNISNEAYEVLDKIWEAEGNNRLDFELVD